ncbi:hypothetical protein EMIHUDRAFT_423476 [Emiliania huxleyi CCMP1516]|uniref:Uncharacterized protein n=2 Tax=Emiliania huxleyi TaxID=2903 RepID=A0A0D3KGT2_EMIH1|nr:hypothetical protein EMIHUDRAFT_423476 [Emiliania huxleyi CCMP1516]EOD34967.1 hypothetical protein EMIHUDRAFT_423476 [Emiliania huxleyi CCMP1516]|eukprot:XP_005787396.1 hypothetical protein EMIHUDRAFT_423476 [Emiliania huxleyi CCMP1516]
MCNPPFYGENEAPRGRADRAGERCEASRSELFTAGGEVGFVSRLISESAGMRDAAGWFSSLVGRKASLSPLLQRLDEAGAVHVRTTELAQGQRSDLQRTTSRWVLAWSYEPSAVPREQARAAADSRGRGGGGGGGNDDGPGGGGGDVGHEEAAGDGGEGPSGRRWERKHGKGKRTRRAGKESGGRKGRKKAARVE